MGRPTVMTDEVIRKVEEGACRGLNMSQAALYAGVSRSALYEYCGSHPEFKDRIDHLREKVGMKAVLNISDEIEAHSTDVSKWYLERRLSQEYSPRAEAALTVSASLSLQDKEKALADFLGGFLQE